MVGNTMERYNNKKNTGKDLLSSVVLMIEKVAGDGLGHVGAQDDASDTHTMLLLSQLHAVVVKVVGDVIGDVMMVVLEC